MTAGQFDGVMYNSDIHGEESERYTLNAHEQIRIAALNAAIAYNPTSINSIKMYADAFAEYILIGEMPKPPAGLAW
jgi:hypothetical protein